MNFLSMQHNSAPKKTPWPLFWIIAISLAPIIAALFAYFYYGNYRTQNTRNYGQLIEPQKNTPDIKVIDESFAQGHQAIQIQNLTQLKGKWVLLYANSTECDEQCVRHLFVLRQVRLSQGKEGNRIVPVWLKNATPFAHKYGKDVAKSYQDIHGGVRFLQTSQLDNTGVFQQNSLYLIDPLGHVMMQYPSIEEPLKIIRDITQLLKWSRVG